MSIRGSIAMWCLVAVGLQLPSLPKAPGKLVDVGGRNLHILCEGRGSPTVVFEAGASSFAIDWTLVQREVAKTHRACSYDRAGMGWSDEADPATPRSTAAILSALLTAAGERPPYVLVGASRGGLWIRDYLIDHSDAVVGLVFVDPSTEDRLFTTIDGKGIAIAEVTAEQLRATFPTGPVPIPRRSPPNRRAIRQAAARSVRDASPPGSQVDR
jgi:pimeloyl-ACP methyl ester carboxylesterase